MKRDRQLLKERIYFLCEVFLSLETLEEYECFLSDVFTISEMKTFVQRIKIAVCLSEGKTFKEISDELGVSSATVERVKQAFIYGKDGYKIVIERLKDLTE